MSDWIDLVNALADGELDGAAKDRAERLVESDPKAAAEFEWARYIRGTLMAKCDRIADQTVWSRCMKRLDEIDALGNTGKVESFVGRFGWVMASLLFVVILAAGVFNRGGNDALSSEQLAAAFPGEIEVYGVLDTERLIQQGLGRSLPTIESVVTVTGASLEEVNGKRYAIIRMTDDYGRLLLYVIQDVSGIEGFDKLPGRGGYSGGMVNGHNCVTWAEDGFAFMVMADRPINKLVGIAKRMRD